MRITDLSTAAWRKSSYSNQDGGACIEVADNVATLVPVRDSKTPHGPVLTFPPATWTSFISALRHGEPA
ncbi:DUF397 domain-containing protein [Streptomyces tubbatahanensis]|uniref:DUF397 domain-containing protein n=1 Tax=Streptomyces tubbatahanensis TaxID=2923272 RepID=A0ABY3XV30_9ACTN|nr:DUF397 domain-containing protein [Streptomyces tubbatahanensis]UNS98337.1 DUF397 domain-containing protein [Streptomyces tubbatahanensis]